MKKPKMSAEKTKSVWIIIAAVIFIVVLGFFVYGNSLKGEFIWDDLVLVRDNAYIKSWSNLGRIFTATISFGAGGRDNSYRPIQTFTYMFDYSLWKLNPTGFHFTNIILHILAALSVFWFINVLYGDKLISFLTGALFIVCPLHTEAVTYISGRADSLAALFLLISGTLYIKQVDDKNLKIYFLMLISFILAVLSRENSLILPVFLLFYHYAFKKKVRVGIFLPIVGLSVLYVLARITFIKSFDSQLPFSSVWERIPSFFAAITNYIRLLFLPVNLHMEYGNKAFSFSDAKVIIGIFIFFSLLIYAVNRRKDNKFMFFSVFWFFIMLLPVSNIFPVNAYMAEHWLYLPSIGFFLIVAKRLSGLCRINRGKNPAVILAVGLVFFYSFLTIKQNQYWKDPITFFERNVKYSPDSDRIYNNLGIAYRERGKINEAMSAYRRAIEINHGDAYAYNNLGIIYNDTGDKEQAAAYYQKAVEVDPRYAQAYYNIGNLLVAGGKDKQAIDFYKKAIEYNPYAIEAYCNLGIIYNAMGQIEAAVTIFKKVIEIIPHEEEGYYNLGNVYAGIGKNNEAIVFYKQAIQKNPREGQVYNNLAAVYLRQREYKLAIESYDQAEKLGLHNPVLSQELKPYREQD